MISPISPIHKTPQKLPEKETLLEQLAQHKISLRELKEESRHLPFTQILEVRKKALQLYNGTGKFC